MSVSLAPPSAPPLPPLAALAPPAMLRALRKLRAPRVKGWSSHAAPLIHDLDLSGPGLEIGALDRPLLYRAHRDRFDLRYLDYADTATLRRDCAAVEGVKLDRIVEVDFPTNGRAVHEVTGENRFAYILASHVVEHVPDLIGWLASCMKALQPGGRLCLWVPDRRFTFDIARHPTAFAALEDAYRMKRTKPTRPQIEDYLTRSRAVDPVAAWRGRLDPQALPPKYPPEVAAAKLQALAADPDYFDCHLWIFRDTEFLALLSEIRDSGLVSFEVERFNPTRLYDIEFMVRLRKPA